MGAFLSGSIISLLLALDTFPVFVLSHLLFGAGEWTRTTDLLITNQLLYRLSYASLRPAHEG